MNFIDQIHQMELEIRRRNFHAFVSNTFPNFIDGWFYQELCDHLQQFMMDIRENKSPRLIINMHPRLGKSEISSIRFPVYCLLNNIDWEIILTSYGQIIVDRLSRRARSLIDSEYVKLLWDAKIACDQSSVKEWRIGDSYSSGTFRAVGKMGGLTGSGANCLVKGTMIKTINGYKKIENIKVNDMVYSFNHRKGLKEYKKVIAVKENTSNIVKLKFFIGWSVKYYKSILKRNNKRILCNKYTKDYIEISCTKDHKFYIQGKDIDYRKSYIEASKLEYGDYAFHINKYDRNEDIRFEKYIDDDLVEKVYDIQVEGNNNFFANGILVHNCIICDDITKDAQEADSFLIKENTFEWYNSVLRTRLAPNGGILIIQTRWAIDDLVGNLLKDNIENWKVISYTALAEEEEPNRKIGEPLHTRFSVEELLKIKRQLPPRWWNALYRQQPINAGGEIIKEEWIKYFDRNDFDLSSCDEVFQSWDLRFSKSQAKTSSYVVGQCWARKDANNYLLDQIRGRFDYADTRDAIREMSKKWPESIAKIIENKANGPAIESDLQNEISGIILYNPRGDKIQRLELVLPIIRSGNVFIAKDVWTKELINEVISFPNSANDDQVDTLSMALAWSLERNGDLGEVTLI